MKKFGIGRFAMGLALLATAVATAQIVVIDDDMNADTSSDYTVINGGKGAGDGSLEFAFDYGTLGIPEAPGTSDGSTTGIYMTVNRTTDTSDPDGNQTEAYTLFHNTPLVGFTDYTMTVDVYLGVFEQGATGSTESAQIGIGGDGLTHNHLFEFDGTNVEFSGSGHFIAISSDGADSSDYRHAQDDANGGGAFGPVNQFDLSYLSPDMGTNVTSANFIDFYENISNVDASIPGIIGNDQALVQSGSFPHTWATVKVEVSQTEGTVTYSIRGGTNETTGVPGENLPPEFLEIVETDIQVADGLVNFGLADMYNSVATDVDNQFAIFDNLVVEGTPGTGGVTGDFDMDSDWDCDDVDALVAEIAAGTNNLSFDMDNDMDVDEADLAEWLAVGGMNNPNETGGAAFLAADANLDGTVDVSDFNIWNGNKFTSVPAFCSGDFNADGSVDVSDFNIWNGLKFTSSGDVAAVPEPNSMTFVACLLFGLLPIVRRRIVENR